MDDFLNAVCSHKPYKLSYNGDKLSVVIPSDVLKFFGKQDIFVLDCLYKSYKKELNGVILNIEEDLNSQLQVSTFLGGLQNALKCNSLVLILCPDEAIIKWHYYMTSCGKFDIKILSPENISERISEYSGGTLLLSFSNIKLVESLVEYEFLSLVIDKFDEIATKMVLRKLQSSFNIGITYRNFYALPDQKLQWTMLNWTNPGCVGKLADFYETDNENFASFRDNYKEWWFRITWSFCESFVRPTLADKGNLSKILREWANRHNLNKYILQQSGKSSNNTRKRKEKAEVPNKQLEIEEDNLPKRTRKVYNKTTAKKNVTKIPYNTKKINNIIKIPISDHEASDSEDSSGTIIYEDCQQNGDVEMQDAEEDEPPIKEEVKEVVTLAQEPENTSDFNDNESVSSDEQLFNSLTNYEKDNTRKKIKTASPNVSDNRITYDDDVSEKFLKSMADQEENNYLNRSQDTEQFLSTILNQEGPESKGLSYIDLEVSEQRILGTEILAESDKFLREICNDKSREDDDDISGVENNNYASTSSTPSDVDLLIAEVMETVRK